MRLFTWPALVLSREGWGALTGMNGGTAYVGGPDPVSSRSVKDFVRRSDLDAAPEADGPPLGSPVEFAFEKTVEESILGIAGLGIAGIVPRTEIPRRLNGRFEGFSGTAETVETKSTRGPGDRTLLMFLVSSNGARVGFSTTVSGCFSPWLTD